jgi:hypothetical protein
MLSEELSSWKYEPELCRTMSKKWLEDSTSIAVKGNIGSVLAFPRTNFCFEQSKVHRKWANRLMEPTFGGSCRIIQIGIS